MTTADVPADGEVRIGAIRLTAGRRIRSNGGRGEPVAWATTEPVPDAGRAWAALSEAHAQSGLVPVLLDGIAGDPERPWDTQKFRDPDDMTELDDLDVAELMREDWLNKTIEYWEDGRENEDEDDAWSRPCRPGTGRPARRCAADAGLEPSSCHRAAFRRRAAHLGGPLRCPAPAGWPRRDQRPGAAATAHAGVSTAPGRRAVGVLQRIRRHRPA
jgi:hypothetical protein